MESELELRSKALQLLGVPPSPREAHSVLLLRDDADHPHRILVFGGGCNSPVLGPQQYNDLFLLDLKEATWSRVSCNGNPPRPRSGHTSSILEDGRVLIFGGSSMVEGYMNDVYLLDPKSWTWSSLQVRGNGPSPRDKHTACVSAGKLYVFGGFGPCMENRSPGNEGGFSSSSNGASDNANMMAVTEDEEEEDDDDDDDADDSVSFTWFNDVHILDLQSWTWEEVQTMGERPSPRAAHAAFVTPISSHSDKSKMVVFGGRDAIGRQNDLFSLDLTHLEWKAEGAPHTASTAPPPRSFHVMVPLIGGIFNSAVSYGGVGADNELFSGLEVLNLQTLQWTSGQMHGTLPPPRGTSAMVARRASNEAFELIIFGGSCNIEGKATMFYNDVYSICVNTLK